MNRKRISFIVLALLCALQLSAADTAAIRDTLTDVTVRVDNVDESGQICSFGSGFFISENGLICTNFHVIEDHFLSGCTLEVLSPDGYRYEAEPVVWNYGRDWAVLKIDQYRQTRYLEFADEVHLLDRIWASGFPVTGNLKITEGSISSFQPDFMGGGQDFYDVSMKFDGGNSGGPVINEDREVVGMVVAYYTDARDMDFIIPITEIVDELYWARVLYDSSAWIPEHITGVPVSSGQTISITNRTGQEIEYLYILDDRMLESDTLGADVLGYSTLPDGHMLSIDPADFSWIDTAVHDLLQMLTIVASDDLGGMYIHQWIPDLESWEITIGPADHESNWSEREEGAPALGFLTVENQTGYSLEYLYLVDMDMIAEGDLGESLLSIFYLHDEMEISVDPEDHPIIAEALVNGKLLTFLAVDDEGDTYMHDWDPAFDGEHIVLTFEDYMMW